MPTIDEKTEYQIIRFHDGKELFAMVRENANNLELHFPMNVNLGPSPTGGVLIHLGPAVPFTTEDSITVSTGDIVYRANIDKQFIEFYDDAVTTWLNMRENNDVEFKSTRQVYEEHKKILGKMLRGSGNIDDIENRSVPRIHEERFSDEMEQLLEEFEAEQNIFSESEPNDKDTIH